MSTLRITLLNLKGIYMNEPIDLPTPPAEPTPTAEPRRAKPRLRWVIIGLLVLVLVGGAAYTAGRLLNGGTIPGFGGGFLPLGSNGGMVSMKLNMERAKELPTTPSDANGIFLKRDNNVITIGTGGGSTVIVMGSASASGSSASQGDSGSPVIGSDHSGPDVDVVITKDTRLYRDATFDQYKEPPKDDEKIQQKLEAGTIEDIGSQSMLTVWGRKSGDRIIADFILFSKPMLFTKSK
jgi:hypothetical protein